MAQYVKLTSHDGGRAKQILDATSHGEAAHLQSLMQDTALSINLAVEGEHDGATPLHIAACKRQVEIVRWIRDKRGERNMNVQLESGFTPLHAVIAESDVTPAPDPLITHYASAEEVVMELLSTGDTDANAVAERSGSRTPLHIAAEMGKLDIIKQLLQWHSVDGICKSHKINFNAVDATGSTALHLAASFGHENVVEELLKHCKAHNNACQGGLESGLLDMAPTNKRRTTPLHVAALFGRPIVVSMLLKSGAPVNRTAFSGHTPLHYAVFSVCPKTVRVILREAEGLKVSEADWKGLTPLEYARELCLNPDNGFTPTERKELIQPDDSKEIMQMLEGFDVHGLRTDRQGYMDSANAILVGAALIASITFSSWLQPPLGFPNSNHVAIEYTAMQAFWIFNSLSFFFAIATVIAGADAALPKKYQGLKDTVAYVRGAVIRASWLLFLAVVSVIGAFACAGFVDLPTTRKDSWYMSITLLVGGITCACFLAEFLRKLLSWTDFSSLRFSILKILRGSQVKHRAVSSNDSSRMDSE